MALQLTDYMEINRGGTPGTTGGTTGAYYVGLLSDLSALLLASSVLTGVPVAPTAAFSTSTTQLATTAFVQAAIPSLTSYAPLASPAFTGTPTVPTATALTSTTQAASTAYADAAVLVEKTRALAAESLLAPLSSPALTGVPVAPTAAAGTNTTQISTTAFVTAAVAAVTLTPASVAPLMDGTAAVGTSLLYARQDHVHPTDTSRAPLASPTLTGTPAAPTATAGTSTTQIATTSFVDTSYAPLASPSLTGTPTMPTAGAGTNTTQGASTAFVTTAIANAITSVYTMGGAWDASAGTFPAGSVKGETYLVTVAGTVNGVIFNVGDSLISNLAGASTTTFSGNWIHDIGALSSVEITTALGYTPANIASPTFTGAPAAPTAAAGTSTTQIATTAFVATSYAPLASPALTGTPTVPTATAGTSTTQAASTAFVAAATALDLPLAGGTMSGAIAMGANKITGLANGSAATDAAAFGQIATALATYAPIASPALTGTPVAPTAAVSTNTTQLATTAFVLGQAATVAPLPNTQTAVVGTSLLYARQDHVHKEALTTLAFAAATRILTYTDESAAATAIDISNSAWMKYAVAP